MIDENGGTFPASAYPGCYYCDRPARYIHYRNVVPCCVACIMSAEPPNGPRAEAVPIEARRLIPGNDWKVVRTTLGQFNPNFPPVTASPDGPTYSAAEDEGLCLRCKRHHPGIACSSV